MSEKSVADLLKSRFKATKNVDAMVKHFQEAVDEFHKRQWEKSLAKGGKFLEAALKALLHEAKLPAQIGRQFKVDAAINELGGNATKGTVDDTIRLTIPRSLRFVYDVTSNRGGRHDPDEVDANEMDATAVLTNCAWVLAEMVRYAQKQGDLTQAKAVVDQLMTRKYPFIDIVDGRVYIDMKSATSAREFGLMLLWQRGTKRMSRSDLVDAIKRQHKRVTLKNAKVAVDRLSNLVDDDGAGNVRLRNAGFREADKLMDADKSGRRR
jgi:hypothetical protein